MEKCLSSKFPNVTTMEKSEIRCDFVEIKTCIKSEVRQFLYLLKMNIFLVSLAS